MDFLGNGHINSKLMAAVNSKIRALEEARLGQSSSVDEKVHGAAPADPARALNVCLPVVSTEMPESSSDGNPRYMVVKSDPCEFTLQELTDCASFARQAVVTAAMELLKSTPSEGVFKMTHAFLLRIFKETKGFQTRDDIRINKMADLTLMSLKCEAEENSESGTMVVHLKSIGAFVTMHNISTVIE